MKTKILIYIILSAPVFYQLDYRQRLSAEVAIPGLAGFKIKKSLETRYRVVKEDPSVAKQNKTNLKTREIKTNF